MADTRNITIEGNASNSTLITGDTIHNYSNFCRETPEILKCLINRKIQIENLKKFTEHHLVQGAPKPIICVIPGRFNESHSVLTRRYGVVELPRLLVELGKQKQSPEPKWLNWYGTNAGLENGYNELRRDLEQKNLELGKNPTMQEVRNALDKNGQHKIFRYEISASVWCKQEKQLLEKWMAYFSGLPPSNHGVLVVVFFCMEFLPLRSIWGNYCMQKFINTLQSRAQSNVLALQKLSPLSIEDIRCWVADVCHNYTEFLHPNEYLDEELLKNLTIKNIFGEKLNSRRPLFDVLDPLDEALNQCRRPKPAGEFI